MLTFLDYDIFRREAQRALSGPITGLTAVPMSYRVPGSGLQSRNLLNNGTNKDTPEEQAIEGSSVRSGLGTHGTSQVDEGFQWAGSVMVSNQIFFLFYRMSGVNPKDGKKNFDLKRG